MLVQPQPSAEGRSTDCGFLMTSTFWQLRKHCADERRVGVPQGCLVDAQRAVLVERVEGLLNVCDGDSSALFPHHFNHRATNREHTVWLIARDGWNVAVLQRFEVLTAVHVSILVLIGWAAVGFKAVECPLTKRNRSRQRSTRGNRVQRGTLRSLPGPHYRLRTQRPIWWSCG
jgi:hypothetical protein